MNEVLQDGSNRSPLLEGETSKDPPPQQTRKSSFSLEDNDEAADEVNNLPQRPETLRSSFTLGGTNRTSTRFQERRINASGSYVTGVGQGQSLTQKQQYLFQAEKSKQLQNKIRDEFKTEFTFWDKTRIVIYHLIEPILLGTIVGASLQISQLETMIYLAMAFGVIMPMILTNDIYKIKIKRTLSFIIIVLALVFLLFKFWVYYQFTTTTHITSKYLLQFLGVNYGQWAATFVNDFIVLIMSSLLVWHYYSQIYQLEAREKQTGTLKYQMKIKFFHFLFGQNTKTFYIITFIIILLDTFFFQSVVQFIILMVQLAMLYTWSQAVQIPQKLLDVFLRTVQVTTFIFLTVSFLLSMPKFLNNFITENSYFFQVVGMQQIYCETLEGGTVIIIWYTAVHKMLLSFGIIMTEVYFVCKKVKLDNEIKGVAVANQVINPVLVSSMSNIGSSNLILASSSQVSSTNQANKIVRQNQLNVSQKSKQITLWEQLENIWILLESPIVLWICRILCFIWIYLYHDYQSLFILIWLLHSTIFMRSNLFAQITSYFYFPLMNLIFLFYFAINIYGIYTPQTQGNGCPGSQTTVPSSREIQLWKYGMYEFRIPPLEVAFMFTTLFSIAVYLRLTNQRIENAKISPQDQPKTLFSQVDFKKTSLGHFFYLTIVYIKYPIFLLLIMSGLGKMDFYHIFLLFVFVWAALYPEAFERNVIWLLVYADFFVFIKYLYTLITTTATPKPWFTILGVSSVYDPNSQQELFRYQPRADQWILVFLVFVQYRRANLIGTDLKAIQQNEDIILAILSKKYVRSYKFTKFCTILINHSVVILTFIGYLLVLTFMRRSILNMVSLLLMLCLLAAYLQGGIKVLLKYWKIVGFYQAFVLLSILMFQFCSQSLIQLSTFSSLYYGLGAYGNALLYWAGYYKFAQPIWFYFLPYVLLFFFAILLQKEFEKKDLRESKILNINEEVEIGNADIIQQERLLNQINQSLMSARPNQIQIEAGENNQNQQPTEKSEFEKIEEIYLFMQYQLSYLIWKVQVVWPLFDGISLYFNLILSMVILIFALYFQLAIVWFVYLFIFLIQTWRLYVNHINYRKEQVERFKQAQESRDSPLTTYSALQARKTKLVSNESDQATRIVNQIIKQESTKLQNSLLTQDRLLITDEQAIEEQDLYRNTIHLVTLSQRGYFWATQYLIVTVAFSILYLGAFIPTIYNYKSLSQPQNIIKQVKPIQNNLTSNQIVFLLFASGLYSDANHNNQVTDLEDRRELMSDYYPFFILLLLLIIEKLSQLWLKDRFKTTDEKIKLFKEIEDRFVEMLDKKQDDKLKASIIKGRTRSDAKQKQTEPLQTDPSLQTEGQQQKLVLGQSDQIEEEKKQPQIETGHQTKFYSSQSELMFSDLMGDQPDDNLGQNQRRISFQVIDDQSEDGYTARFTYNPNSTQQIQTKRELMNQIKPRLQIKSQRKLDLALRALLVELLIMLVWFSCIYKQSVLSFVLYFALVWHTYNKNHTVSVVGLTVFLVFVLQYIFALLSLSSYNSPQPFPFQISNGTCLDGNVYSQCNIYPNLNQSYFAVPIYFQITKNKDPPQIQVANWEFFNFDIGGRRLNGIWIDFCVIAIMYFYLNWFNNWMLHEPIKIIPSNYTNHLIREYYDLKFVKQQQRDTDQLRRELTAEETSTRVIKGLSAIIYTNFSLLLIMFVLFISIFSKTLLSFGYFIFSMILIYNNRNFFKDTESSSQQTYILKYWLMPYLLLDILLQLIFQIPLNGADSAKLQNKFLHGQFKNSWLETPATLTFGQNVTIVNTIQTSMVALFLKGMVYFMVSCQIMIVQSMGFKRFSDQVLLDNVKNANEIGMGMAYRFNNFKNRKVIAQARDYSLIEKMLNHVKDLIKRREKIFQDSHNIQKQSINKQIIAAKQDVIVEEEEKNETDHLSQDVEPSIQVKIQTYKSQFLKEVEVEYKSRIENLDLPSKLYLWLRRNFVQDILFKHSNDHLVDTVEQFRLGRTSIKTQLEIGIMMQTKFDWLKTKLTEIQKQVNISGNEQDVKLLEEFQKFRKEQIALSEPKPWERLNLRTFRTTKKLIQNYLVMFYKILASYTHLFCYFFMMLALFTNGGVLYFVYPFAIFGIAMMEESRPGKTFWYFIIIYTQILIILQFLTQLNVWQDKTGLQYGGLYWPWGKKIYQFSLKYNIGLYHIGSEGFSAVLKCFYPEILILVFVLLHIQQETLAGLFNVSLQEYESFEDGLDRYIRIVLANDQKSLQQYEDEQYMNRIREGINFDAQLVIKRRNSAPDVLVTDKEDDPDGMLFDTWQNDVDKQILKYPLYYRQQPKRSTSMVDLVDLEDLAVILQNEGKITTTEKIKQFVQQNIGFMWDNSFFDRLFPLIKQQKPGQDLYIYVALVEIVLCLYIFFFFTDMTQQTSNIAQQFASNQFQGPMVVALFVIIGLAIIDRIFYSSFAFLNRINVNKKLNIDGPLIEPTVLAPANGRDSTSQLDNTFFSNQPREAKQSIRQQQSPKNQSFSNQLQNYEINRSRAGSVESNAFFVESNPADVTLMLDTNLDQKEQQVYYQSLIPQYNEKYAFKVVKFYYQWLVLILVHWYIFLYLTKYPSVICPPHEGVHCNLPNQNPALLTFYLIWCIYFMLSAYQIQVGLPELKKGGFMMGQFNSVSKAVYEIWYYIPFLFELRTIIDWTFTSTALDVFQSIKLSQAQSDLYIAKCYNKPYRVKELGSEIKWYMKLLIGASLMAFIILLICGPILLFSTLNPVSNQNPVQTGTLAVAILIRNQTSSFTIPLFETRQVTQNTTMDSPPAYNNPNKSYNDIFSALQFEQPNATTTNQFKASQGQVIQFAKESDTVWLISNPKLKTLQDALEIAKITPPNADTETQTVTIELTADFIRSAPQASKGEQKYDWPLNDQTTLVIDQLLTAIQCDNAANGNSTNFVISMSAGNPLFIAIELGSSLQASNITTPEIKSGATLSYFCDSTNNATSYWSLSQSFNISAQPYSQCNDTQYAYLQQCQIYDEVTAQFLKDSGFGFFILSQTVLPAALAAYASSIIFFYVAVVYVIASAFRSAFVPVTSQIFITDAVATEDMLMICQCIYIYRVQRNHKNEEELFFILIDILRSPEMIKAISGTSLKKSLE